MSPSALAASRPGTWKCGDGAAQRRGDVYDVAASGDGGVYVALNDLDVVRYYTRDGRQVAEWAVDGLDYPISTAPGGRAWSMSR